MEVDLEIGSMRRVEKTATTLDARARHPRPIAAACANASCTSGRKELSRLSAEFDSRGRISANNGCWQPGDLDGERRLVYLEELIVDLPWLSKGIGGVVFPTLFELKEVDGARFIFS
ncbi:hypothetical protein FB45DRAFT_1051304 [Roridomyces roridus]|uniref:Uncharacterized protein n=1 Tax=Roridomyces roridus TaxID=1738132 RepID=A0AAD7CDW9_9AGAR|nr:hypothetical protein FB45DRAFT_1051304 [Roridomyces roridus]